MAQPRSEAPVDPALLADLLNLVDLLTPHAIRVAVTLGLPELIAGGATTRDLADRTAADPGALTSLLHFLAGRGLLEIDADGQVEPTDLGRLLTHPDARAALDLRGAQAKMELAWAGLEHTIRTGQPCYSHVHGLPFWQHLASDPALGSSFDDYMTRSTTWTAAAAALPVWPDTGLVVDVGGGIGWLLADVLDARPDLRGTHAVSSRGGRRIKPLEGTPRHRRPGTRSPHRPRAGRPGRHPRRQLLRSVAS